MFKSIFSITLSVMNIVRKNVGMYNSPNELYYNMQFWNFRYLTMGCNYFVGVKQAQVLTKTLYKEGLPPAVTDNIGKVRLPRQV